MSWSDIAVPAPLPIPLLGWAPEGPVVPPAAPLAAWVARPSPRAIAVAWGGPDEGRLEGFLEALDRAVAGDAGALETAADLLAQTTAIARDYALLSVPTDSEPVMGYGRDLATAQALLAALVDAASGDQDGRITAAHLRAVSRSVAADYGTLAVTHVLTATCHAAGLDLGQVAAALSGLPILSAAAEAPGQLTAIRSGRVPALGLRGPGQLAGGQLAGTIRAAARIRAALTAGNLQGARVRAAGRGSGQLVVTPVSLVINQYTANQSNIAVPPWCRWVAAIALGAGGGGAGGNQLSADGRGGDAGSWSGQTWDRGIGRNQWNLMDAVIGNGGSGGSRNNNGSGNPGGASTMTLRQSVTQIGQVVGSGGNGGSGTNPVFDNYRPGKAPGNFAHEGQTYTGGSGNSNEPGSGGQGGGGSTWPLNSGTGSAGAKGRAWAAFWM